MATAARNAAPTTYTDPDMLIEHQRIVDMSVRIARDEGYCNHLNVILGRIFPALKSADGRFFDSAGRDCYGQAARRQQFNANGYDEEGYDRDGYSQARNRQREYRQGRPATPEEAIREAAPALNPTAAIIGPNGTLVMPTPPVKRTPAKKAAAPAATPRKRASRTAGLGM